MDKRYELRDNFEINKMHRSLLMAGKEDDGENIYISYVIPTYHRIETLKEAVMSVVRVAHRFVYEIIVVDNSNDAAIISATKEFLLGLNDPHIKYFLNEKNLGMEGNWNRGIELARGKYVSFLHDDDLLDVNYEIEIQNILLKEPRKIGFIKVQTAIFHEGGEKPPLKQKLQGNIRRFRRINAVVSGYGLTYTPTCGILFDRDAVAMTGGFDSRLHPSADQIIGFLIMQQGYRGYGTEDQLGYYRVGLNESMRLETAIGFCKKDTLIREYMYRDNVFFRMFGMLLGRTQYTLSIENIHKNMGNVFQCSYGIDALDYRSDLKPRKIGKRILRILNAGCGVLTRIL